MGTVSVLDLYLLSLLSVAWDVHPTPASSVEQVIVSLSTRKMALHRPRQLLLLQALRAPLLLDFQLDGLHKGAGSMERMDVF